MVMLDMPNITFGVKQETNVDLRGIVVGLFQTILQVGITFVRIEYSSLRDSKLGAKKY